MEIKSIKDLKREIEKQKNAHMGEGVLDLIWVLDLLNSVEAEVKKQFEEISRAIELPPHRAFGMSKEETLGWKRALRWVLEGSL